MYKAKHELNWESKDLIWSLILGEQKRIRKEEEKEKKKKRREEEEEKEKRSSKKIKGMKSCVLLDFGRDLYGFQT